MTFFNFINQDQRTVRIRIEKNEISVDAEGRFFTLDFPYTVSGVSVSGDRILLLTEEYAEGKGDLYCYAYNGTLLWTSQQLFGEELPLISGSVMTSIDVIPLFSRYGIKVVADHAYYLATPKKGGMAVIDLTDGEIVLVK